MAQPTTGTPQAPTHASGLHAGQPLAWARALLDALACGPPPALLLVPGALPAMVDALRQASETQSPGLTIDTALTPAAFAQLRPGAAVAVLEDVHLFPLRCVAASLSRRVASLRFLSPYGSARTLHPLQLAALEAPRRVLFAAQRRVHATSPWVATLEHAGMRALRRLCADAPALTPVPAVANASRVLFVIGSLGTGGAERQLVTTVLGLQRVGLVPHVALVAPTSAPDHFASALVRAGIPVHRLRAFPFLPPRELLPLLDSVHRALSPVDLSLPTAVNLVLRLIHAYAIDTVHCFLDFPSVAGGLAGVLARVPRVVLGLRSIAPPAFPQVWKPCLRPGLRELFAHSTVRTTANSAAGAADYRRWLGPTDVPVHVIQNGVPAPAATADAGRTLRSSLGVAATAPILAGVFRIVDEKDPDLFVAAAAVALQQRPDLVVVHAGGGTFSAAARASVSAFAQAGRFIPIGVTDLPEVLMREASVVLLTSHLEGLPNVLIEAQLQGTPVVSTDAGGAKETFIDGETGTLVTTRSAAALAAAALEFIGRGAEPQLRATIAERARVRFSEARMITALLALYAEPPRSTHASRNT